LIRLPGIYTRLCFLETFAGPATHDKKLVYSSDSAEPDLELNGFYLLFEEFKDELMGFEQAKKPFHRIIAAGHNKSS
jgi:hypothetical protein